MRSINFSSRLARRTICTPYLVWLIALYIIIFALEAQAQPIYQVTTLAGSTAGYADGVGVSAKFNSPTGLFIDKSGNVLVSDWLNNCLRLISPSAVVTTLAGSRVIGYTDGNAANAQFRFPNGIVVDSRGNIFIADRINNIIRKLTPSGEVTTFAGNINAGFRDGNGINAEFNRPSALAIDQFDNIYVTDFFNNCIRKITPSGNVTKIAGSGALGYLDGSALSAQFYYPTGIAVDKQGNIYVSDYNHVIRKITPNGMVSTLAGTNIPGYADGNGINARFNNPHHLVIDNSNNIFIIDVNNHRVRRVNLNGDVSTIAGSSAGFADGVGNQAQFNLPFGIALDAANNLYVSDGGNHKIRKLTLIEGLTASPNALIFPVPNNPVPSEIMTYTLTGINLLAPVTITPPRGFTVSVSSTGTFSSTLTIPIDPQGFVNQLIYIRREAITTGAVVNAVINNVSGTASAAVTLNAPPAPLPSLRAVPDSLLLPPTPFGESSNTRRYELRGAYLTNPVTISVPNGLEISLNPSGPFSTSLTLSPNTGSILSAIFVRSGTANRASLNRVPIIHESGTLRASVLVSVTVIPPSLTASPAGLVLPSTPFGVPSNVEQYILQGINLSAPVTVSAPNGLEIALNQTGPFFSSLILNTDQDGYIFSRNYDRSASYRIFVRSNGLIPGMFNRASIIHRSDTLQAIVNVLWNVVPPPVSLTANPQELSLGNIILNSRTTIATFTVTGIGLRAPVSITAPPGVLLFDYSTTTWRQSLTLSTGSTGNVTQPVSVRLDSSRIGPVGRIGTTGTRSFITVTSDTLSARVHVSGLVREAPQLVALPDSLFFGTLRLGNPAPFTLPTERRYTLVGTNLTDTLVITAPPGIQIFDTVSNSWQSTIRFPITPAPFSANLRTTLTVRIDSSRLGAISANLVHQSGQTQASVRIRGEVIPMPLLQASPESLTFPSIVQGDSVGTREYVLTGSNLPANVVVTAPDGVLLLNPATNTWVRSFTLATNATGSVMQRIAVRIDSVSVRTFSNAAITHQSSTAAFSTQATVLVSGSILPLTLPQGAETTLELRLVAPRTPLLIRDTARVQLWLKDSRLLNPRLIGRFVRNLRATVKIDTNNFNLVGLAAPAQTRARFETQAQLPRTSTLTTLLIERIDTSTTREMLLAELLLQAALGATTTNTVRASQPTEWLGNTAANTARITWGVDSLRLEIRPLFAPRRQSTFTVVTAPNPSAGEVELQYTLSPAQHSTEALMLVVCDMAGRVIERRELGTRKTGERQREIVNLRGLSVGAYRVLLVSQVEILSSRVDIVK